jgi:hypothetical protein
MWKQIFKTTLVVGILDIIAAFLQAYLTNKVSPDIVLKYIASGVFGDEAFDGGFNMLLAGLLFHFTIAFACAIIFFLLYPKLKFLHHKIAFNSFLIAVAAWVITTQIIMQLSKVSPPTFTLAKVLTAIVILFVCVGFPIAYSAKKFFG